MPYRPLTFGIDVDEVVAQLHAPWIEWGNRRWNTRYEHFTGWNDPMEWWGEQAMEFICPETYRLDGIVQPYPLALLGINILRARGHNILFVTHCLNGTESAKMEWLRRYRFMHRDSEFLSAKNKSAAPVDVLVDDGYHNCAAFQGRAVLMTRSHNLWEPWRWERISSVIDLPYLFA